MVSEILYLLFSSMHLSGLGSSVSIATCCGPDSLGIESQWGEIFRRPDRPWGHPASCAMRTGSLLGVKYGRGVLLTTHPLLLPRSWKSRAIPLPTLWATTGPVMGTHAHNICVWPLQERRLSGRSVVAWECT